MIKANDDKGKDSWLRGVSVLALAWNLIGLYFFLVHAGAIPGPSMSEADQALKATMPAVVTAVFAVGVFAGTLGSIGLLLLKRWALPVLLVSLAGLLTFQSWYLFISGAPAILGISAVPLPVAIVAVAVLLVWLARNVGRSGRLA